MVEKKKRFTSLAFEKMSTNLRSKLFDVKFLWASWIVLSFILCRKIWLVFTGVLFIFLKTIKSVTKYIIFQKLSRDSQNTNYFSDTYQMKFVALSLNILLTEMPGKY